MPLKLLDVCQDKPGEHYYNQGQSIGAGEGTQDNANSSRGIPLPLRLRQTFYCLPAQPYCAEKEKEACRVRHYIGRQPHVGGVYRQQKSGKKTCIVSRDTPGKKI